MATKRRSITKTTARKQTTGAELDSVFLLKLVLYMVIGSQWLRIESQSQTSQIPIPVGLIIGIMFAMHDHFQIDRKIEYALLLIATFVGFWLPMGISIVR